MPRGGYTVHSTRNMRADMQVFMQMDIQCTVHVLVNMLMDIVGNKQADIKLDILFFSCSS
jgi:hypothetical protein